jgi:hypothetical protein
MKKLYLLLGMIILSAFANLGAMERLVISEAREALDQYTADEIVNWEGVFRVLEFYRDRMSDIEFNNLINHYHGVEYDEPLLELAVEEYNVPAARRLLQEFNAQVTNAILTEAKSYVNDKKGLVELLYQYGGAQ